MRFFALDMLSKHTHINDILYLILKVQVYMYTLLKRQMSRPGARIHISQVLLAACAILFSFVCTEVLITCVVRHNTKYQ
jgi:hypothetical protein